MNISKIQGVGAGIGKKLAGAVKKAADLIRADKAISNNTIPYKAAARHAEKNDKISYKFLDKNITPFYSDTVVNKGAKHYNRVSPKEAEAPKGGVSFFSIIEGGIKDEPQKPIKPKFVVIRPEEKMQRIKTTWIENTSMDIAEFMAFGVDKNFNFEPVFNHLNATLGVPLFDCSNVEKIVVSPDATKMTFITQNGVNASMDFKTGGRYITSVTKEGLSIPVVNDKKGLMLDDVFDDNFTDTILQM